MKKAAAERQACELGDCKGRKGWWATQGPKRCKSWDSPVVCVCVALAASPTGTMQMHASLQDKEEENWFCLRSHPRSHCSKGHTEPTMTF